MKFLRNIPVVLILLISGCISLNKTNININIPDLDTNGYNDPFYIEGWKYLKNGDFNKAYTNFSDSSSKNEKLYTGFGYVYLMKNKIKLSKRNFLKALELNPENINASIGLATIEEVSGNKFKAFSLYSTLVVKYPENRWIKSRFEFIKTSQTELFLKKADKKKNEGKIDEYIHDLQRAAFFSPEDTDIKLRIADHFRDSGNFKQAVFYYESALENRQNDLKILHKLAESYENSGELDSAILIYKKISELSPDDNTISDKINNLKIKFHEMNLPVKFKDIFFKESINREELAALIGHYFRNYISAEIKPVIITDIRSSFVKDIIIKLCTSGIMKALPDHTFRKNQKITRTSLIITLNSLLEYLQKKNYVINFTPSENDITPEDISPRHKYYKIIKFLLNSKIIKLDDGDIFNGSREITPSELLLSLRKIIKGIENKRVK